MPICCPTCPFLPFCRKRPTELVTDQSLNNPEYIRDLRNFAHSLGISYHHWHDAMVDMYCRYNDYDGCFMDEKSEEVDLNLDEFERDNIKFWFRDFCSSPVPDHIEPRITDRSRERVRILATILTAIFPSKALLWGVRPANDN